MRATVNQNQIAFVPATDDDFEELFALRMAAMHDSLERIGRLDAIRSRERFEKTFTPGETCKILLSEECIGFFSISPVDDGLLLGHLYVHPNHQGSGIGTVTLRQVIAKANAEQLPLRLCALRGSESNNFYQRHGFVQTDEQEWDIYYERPPDAI